MRLPRAVRPILLAAWPAGQVGAVPAAASGPCFDVVRHQCGSHLLRRLGPGRTDLFLYDEIDARRRSAEDTRDMQRGILRNIRENLFQSGRPDDRVEELQVSAW